MKLFSFYVKPPYKGKLKRRRARNKLGKVKRSSSSLDYSKAVREPWILATSLGGKSYLHAKRVINKYQKRMQIEEGFRDLKSTRYGFSFKEAYSKNRKRIEILLLIAMIASFLAWMIGWVAEKSGLHLQFQANTIKNRRVLSFFYLGCRIVKKKIKIPIDEALEALIHEGLPQC